LAYFQLEAHIDIDTRPVQPFSRYEVRLINSQYLAVGKATKTRPRRLLPIPAKATPNTSGLSSLEEIPEKDRKPSRLVSTPFDNRDDHVDAAVEQEYTRLSRNYGSSLIADVFPDNDEALGAGIRKAIRDALMEGLEPAPAPVADSKTKTKAA
jgi:hypothetical protein